MDGVRNFKSFAGTLAGVPVDLAGPSGTQAWVIFNDDAVETHTFGLNGQTFAVRAGEAVPLPFAGDHATIDGAAGDYRILAVEDAAALPFIVRQDSTATKVAAALAGNGLTGGGGAALVVKPDVTTGGNTVAVKVAANGVGLDVNDLADGTNLSASGTGKLVLTAGSVKAHAVGIVVNDGTGPAPDVIVATALADATGNEDIALVLTAGTVWKAVDHWVEQDGVGGGANNYTLQKGAAAIGSAIVGSGTDGAILRAGAIPAANKAANSFSNGDTLRWAVAKAAGTAAGVGYVRLRRVS